MPEQVSTSASIALQRSLPLVLLAAIVGLMLAGSIALWMHYGTAVFFEMIRTGFAACFG